MEEEKKQKKEITLEELLKRAEASDTSEKYAISSNYYYLALSRHSEALSKDKAKFNEVLYKFIFDTLMLNNPVQKEKFLNFLVQNEKLGVSKFQPIFEKFFNYQMVYKDELKDLLLLLPSTHKNINIDKALFEHNFYSLSRVFTNISFDSLEKFLKMKIDDILVSCISMISEGIIKAKIDDNLKFVNFFQEPSVSTDFDEQIKNFCLKAKNLAEYIQAH